MSKHINIEKMKRKKQNWKKGFHFMSHLKQNPANIHNRHKRTKKNCLTFANSRVFHQVENRLPHKKSIFKILSFISFECP